MISNTEDVTVFIIDDDDGARRGLERLVRSAGWAVQSYATAESFLERLPYDGVGCILLDVRMPGMTGPELQDRMLALGISVPIVYLTGHADVPMSVNAMKNGALDILLKPAGDDLVLAAIAAATEKHRALCAAENERTRIACRVSRLSNREREVMECVISGRLNKQIAGDLGIAEKTVKVHRARVMEKLEARSVAALVRMCELAGIAPREFRSEHPRALPGGEYRRVA
jgi:FixJ family two-component response regulator